MAVSRKVTFWFWSSIFLKLFLSLEKSSAVSRRKRTLRPGANFVPVHDLYTQKRYFYAAEGPHRIIFSFLWTREDYACSKRTWTIKSVSKVWIFNRHLRATESSKGFLQRNAKGLWKLIPCSEVICFTRKVSVWLKPYLNNNLESLREIIRSSQ